MLGAKRQNGAAPSSRLRSVLVLIGFLVIAGYFLWAEHRAHVMLALPYLPWLLLLACPLMHIFMHHGHGEHGKQTDRKQEHRHD